MYTLLLIHGIHLEHLMLLARFALEIREYRERWFRHLSSEAAWQSLATNLETYFNIWPTLQHGTKLSFSIHMMLDSLHKFLESRSVLQL